MTIKQLEPYIFFNTGQLGTQALSASQVKGVLTTLTNKELPKCMQTIDPTDDAFMKLESLPELPKADPPEGMLGKMLPFQQQGLAWMVAQELGEYKGGVLADEMGLGKTIQTISLLMQAKQRGTAAAPKAKRGRGAKQAKSAAAETDETGGPTLVVLPTSALMQWSEEIKTFAGDGLNVLVYYGKKDRATAASDMAAYDVRVQATCR